MDQMNEEASPMILEERLGQYATKRNALNAARLRERETGKRHNIAFTHTWRDLQKKSCWTVILK